ncbi:hypothetical protein DXG03_008883, partial [Asterophora parasitica]
MGDLYAPIVQLETLASPALNLQQGLPQWEKCLPQQLVVTAMPKWSLQLKVELETTNMQEVLSVQALVDSGATGCFLNSSFI